MSKITKRFVDSVQADASRVRMVWDDQLKGFGLRVTPNGVKAYILQYRTVNGRERRYTIGRHGSPWTPENARAEANQLLYRVGKGDDPSADRMDARTALTIRELAEIYLREGPADKPNKKASSWETDKSNINRHILPLLGARSIKEITQTDIAKFQRDVADGKTACDEKTKLRGRAIVEGGKGVASRTLAVLGSMYEFALRRKYCSSNPCRGVKLFSPKKVEYYFSIAEITLMLAKVGELEARRALNGKWAAAVRLLLVTGARKTEILSLKWEYVDFERKILTLPDSKTGWKIIRLPQVAVNVLLELRNQTFSGHDSWVLPSDRAATHVKGLQKAFKKVCKHAGLPGRIHDLRHTFASFALQGGASLYHTGKALGHKKSATTEVYAHLVAGPVEDMVEKVGQKLMPLPALSHDTSM